MSWKCNTLSSDYNQKHILAASDLVDLLLTKGWAKLIIRGGDNPKYLVTRHNKTLMVKNGYVDNIARDIQVKSQFPDDAREAWFDARGMLVKYIMDSGEEVFFNGCTRVEHADPPSIGAFVWLLMTTIRTCPRSAFLVDKETRRMYDLLTSSSLAAVLFLGVHDLPLDMVDKINVQHALIIAQFKLYEAFGEGCNIQQVLLENHNETKATAWEHALKTVVTGLVKASLVSHSEAATGD